MRHPHTVVANDGVAPNGPITADNPDLWLTGNDGMPLSLSNPTHITVGLAPVGTTIGGVTVSNVLDTQEITLLKAATQIWESLANVQFQLVDSSTTVPDISVGLADLNWMHNACSDPRSPTLSTGAADGAPYTCLLYTSPSPRDS